MPEIAFSKLTYYKEYKKILGIAVPVALSQLGHIAVGVADSIMVGKLGSIPLAAVTIAFSVFVPFMMLGIGISYGVSPLVAKADGEGDLTAISGFFKNSMCLNIGIGLFLTVALYFAAPLLHLLNQPSEVISLTIPFFRILALTMFPLMIFQVFRQFAEGLAVTRQAMYITITANILNILLNYLLIYGYAGFPECGINGPAYATLCSRIFMAIAMFAFVIYFPRFQKYKYELAKAPVSIASLSYLFSMSIPVGIQMSLEAGAFGFAAIMIGWLGPIEIAAHHVALNMASVSYMAATGIASAATVRVGNYLGRKDYIFVRNAGYAAFHIVLLFMGICAIWFICFRHTLPALYIQDAEVNRIAVGLLLITALFQLSDGMQTVGLGALRGLGDVKLPTAIALVSYWLIGLPVGYVLAFVLNFGVEGVWYGLFLGLSIAALLLYLRFLKRCRQLQSQLK